jgi:two-component sensor histidine kinase
VLQNFKTRHSSARIIRGAIDSYPDGICFALANGRPILVNEKMNEVCSLLTGYSVTNANETWKQLKEREIKDIAWEEENAEEKNGKETVLCSLQEGMIWQFQRSTLSVRNMIITQYEASDITELYEYQRRLRESNRILSEMHDRQRALLQNIIQNNLNQEFLKAKMQIHSEFGRLLVMTRSVLKEKNQKVDSQALFDAWDAVISDMENASIKQYTDDASPEEELTKVADLIGCCITFQGGRPREKKALQLLCAAVREALINAVKHAEADRLTVNVSEQAQDYQVQIQGNGREVNVPLQEKGGLISLRKKLEQEGATLEYHYDGTLVLALKIPKE